MHLKIVDLPLPPSDNNLFPTVKTKVGTSVRVQSKAYKEWLNLMGGYRLVHNSRLRAAHQAFRGHRLEVTITLFLEWEKVYTKTKTANDIVQKFDAHNRIKALCDWLAGSLNIDDSWFFKVSIEKIAHHRTSPIQTESVTIEVRPLGSQPSL